MTPSNLKKMCSSYNEFMKQHEKTGITIKEFAKATNGKYYTHSHISRMIRACVDLKYAKHEHNKAKYEFILRNMQPIHARKVLNKMADLYSIYNDARINTEQKPKTVIKKDKIKIKPQLIIKNKTEQECYVIYIFGIPFIKITKNK